MIHYLERFLIILGAFQPLITLFIGCIAIYVSFITFRNARLAREHTVNCQIFDLKRDIRICCNESVNHESDCLNDMENELSLIEFKLDQQFIEENAPLDKLKEIIDSQRSDVVKVKNDSLEVIQKLNTDMSLRDLEHLLFEVEEKKIKSYGSITRILKKTKILCELIILGNKQFIEGIDMKAKIKSKEEEIQALENFIG